MRIISGTYKGRRFQAPKNLPTRPTTDRAKEALFNILNNRYYFDEINVLDLFAGIGSISLEFASRGTLEITSVDRHVKCVQFIEKTAQSLEAPLRVVKADVFRFLETYKGQTDLIFADPPYSFTLEEITKIHGLVFKKQLLKTDGIFIIEHAKHTNLSQLDFFSDQKNYGGSSFSFFENPS